MAMLTFSHGWHSGTTSVSEGPPDDRATGRNGDGAKRSTFGTPSVSEGPCDKQGPHDPQAGPSLTLRVLMDKPRTSRGEGPYKE